MNEKTEPKQIPLADGTPIYAVPNMDRVYVTRNGQTVYGPDPDTGELKPLTQYTKGRRVAAVWIPGHGINDVHKLVCKTFHGEPPSARHIVARNNGDTTDNGADNLRWDTRWNAGKAAFERRNPPTERRLQLAARKQPRR